MTRRTEAVAPRATNNIYTALTGVACLAMLIALVLVVMNFRSLAPNQPLFFGLF